MGAAVAMGAEIDDERPGRDLDLVGAEQEQNVDAALPPFAPHRARRRRARSPRSSAATRDAALCRTRIPFQPSLSAPNSIAALAASAAMAAPSGRAKAPAPIRIERTFGRLQRFGEFALAEIGERFPRPAPRYSYG